MSWTDIIIRQSCSSGRCRKANEIQRHQIRSLKTWCQIFQSGRHNVLFKCICCLVWAVYEHIFFKETGFCWVSGKETVRLKIKAVFLFRGPRPSQSSYPDSAQASLGFKFRGTNTALLRLNLMETSGVSFCVSCILKTHQSKCFTLLSVLINSWSQKMITWPNISLYVMWAGSKKMPEDVNTLLGVNVD